MNLEAFSLRDYVLYLFPGVALALCGALVDPRLWVLAKDSPALATLALLTLGYCAGFAARQFGLVLFKPFLRMFLGDPFSTALGLGGGSASGTLGKGLRAAVITELRRRWPPALLDNEKEASILFLCQREVEVKQHLGVGYLERLVALYGLALNLMLPTVLLAAILVIKQEYWMSVVALVGFVLFGRAYHRYRQAYARNVYRMWYILNGPKRSEGAESANTDS